MNNSTNIIIKNDHLSPQIIEYKNDHDIYNVGNSDPGLEQAQQCGRAKSFNRITILPSLQLVLQWQYIYKQTIKKPAHIRFHYKRQHIITRMNENKV